MSKSAAVLSNNLAVIVFGIWLVIESQLYDKNIDYPVIKFTPDCRCVVLPS